jgi:hypothetical protein
VEDLALFTDIKLGWKGLPGTSTLAFSKKLLIADVKSFITLARGPMLFNYYARNLRMLVIS